MGRDISDEFALRKGRPFLLLLSGESFLEVLKHIDTDNLGPAVTVGMLDERFFVDPRVNHFAQFFRSTFGNVCLEKGCSFIRTDIAPGECFSEYVLHYRQGIEGWCKRYKEEGYVCAVIEIGVDGRVAGITPTPEFPLGFEYYFEQEAPIVGYREFDQERWKPIQDRVTVTNTFLREYVDEAFVYVCGRKKKPALTKAFSEKGKMHITPARVLCEMKAVRIYTDLALS